MRVVGVVVPVVAADVGADGNVGLNVGVDDRVVIPDWNAGFHVDAGGPVQVTVRVRFDQQFTGRCIVDVEEAVTAGLEQRTDRFSFDFEVSDEVLAGLVKVPLVLGSVGVGPHHFPGRGVTRNRGSAVLVRVVVKCGREGRITAVVRVPGRAVRCAVVEQVRIRIVGEVTPGGAAPEFPGVAVPGVHAGFGPALVDVIERIPAVTDAHFVVRACAVVFPGLFAGFKVVGCYPAAHAALAAFVTDDDQVVNDEGGVGRGFADAQVGNLDVPQFFACLCIEGEQLTVERVDDNFAIGIADTARLRSAAGGGLVEVRLISPV